MAKVKIYELAKEIDKPSKDIINYLKDRGVEVKSHMSNIEDNNVDIVKKYFSSGDKSASKPVVSQSVPSQSAPSQSAPSQSAPSQSAPSQNTFNSHSTSSMQQNARPNQSTAQGQSTMNQSSQNRPYNNQNQNNRPNNNRYQGGQSNQRPMGDNNQNRPTGQNGQPNQNRPMNSQYGQNTNNRPYNNQSGTTRPAGQDGQYRPAGGQQGRPNTNSYNQNPRPYQNGDNNGRPNQNPSSRPYQGSANTGNPNQTGERRPYQGQPYGQRSDQGQSGERRPYNSYQGNRPDGQQGGYNNQNRTDGGQGGYNNQNRTGGQQGGYNNQNRTPGQQGGYNNQNRTGGQQGGYSSQNRTPGQQGGYSQNRTGGGQQGGGYNNQNRTGGQGGGTGYQNRSYGTGNNNYRSNDTRSNDRTNDTKKLDAPLGMSRSDSVNNRNNRTNKNNKPNNKNNNYGRKPIDDDMNLVKVPKKGQFIMPKPVQVQEVEDDVKVIVIPEVLTIKELADKMKKPASALVKKLFLEGKMVSINQEITFEEAEEIALEYEIIAEKEVVVNVVEELLKEEDEDPTTLVKRPAVVCVMGHVDHGKTSLLDAIRETHVTSHEAGGITQHIGAYVVDINGEKITFLDTPGHEAFTSMRMRGAQSTDIAILVVAADDGVMPQTVEAISHAKAAGIQIIVAINKIDKPSANIERVKQELTEYSLVAEDWGGDTIFVPVSAHTKEGITQLLEMILLTAEISELKANPDRNARGVVIEAELDKGRGPVATILVQKGTLRVGDSIVIGSSYGKVRAMMDDLGRRVKEAGPSTPVEILGLNVVPDAGEVFMATDNEKEARNISEAYVTQGREKLLADTKAKLSLDGLFSQIKAGNVKELNIIVKADVQGSVEAVKQSLQKLSNDEVAVRIIHGGVGAINESDVILASASNAIIIGFNVRPDNAAKETADREKVDVRLYRVIYNAIEDVEAAMKGMLDPIFEEKVIGHAEVRQVFKASGLGTIAGSYVLDGKITRGCSARILREQKVIFDGSLASVKRFKDDVKEVASGYECGLVFEKYNDVKEYDMVELYVMQEIPR